MNSRIHNCAIFLAAIALLTIASGAFITSTEVAARQIQSAAIAGIDSGIHRGIGIGLIAIAFGLALWMSITRTRAWLTIVAWMGVAILIVDATLGWTSAPLSPGAGVFHALLAHLFFSVAVAISVGTSRGWNRDPERISGAARPLLRPAALATPLVVVLQVALGAAYRHDMTSIMPHMGVAMGVACLALIVSSVVLQNFPRPASLRHAATALISIVLTQVCLGITAFVILVLNATGTVWFIVATIGHVSIGAATLAASVVMAMQAWRTIAPRSVAL
jgi:heme A synthase